MSTRLCLHGFTGSPGSWAFLREQGVHALTPALVGHAEPGDFPGVTRFEDEVERLAALAPPGEALHLVGYSLGARLALGLALRDPGRVQSLTLISGHPGLHDDAERSARRASDAEWIELLRGEGLPAFVDAWERLPLWSTQARLPEAVRSRKRAERLAHHGGELARSLVLTGLAEMPNYRERLARLDLPVRLLAGERDPKFSALAKQMAARLPRASLEIVPDAGHDLLLESPEFVTEVIRRGNQT